MDTSDRKQYSREQLATKEELKNEIGRLEAKLDNGLVKLDHGLLKQDEGLHKLDEGLLKLDQGLSKLDQGLSKLDQGLSKLDQGLQKMDETRQYLGILYEEMKSNFRVVLEVLSPISPRLENVETRLQRLEDDVVVLKAVVAHR